MKKQLELHLEDRIQITERVLEIFNNELYLHSSKMEHKSQSGLSRVDAHGLGGYCTNGSTHLSLVQWFKLSVGKREIKQQKSELTGTGTGN